MADIRSYMKEKDKREKKQASYKQKIARHRLTAVYRIVLLLVAFGALAALVVVQYKRHIYTDYDILSSIEKEGISGTVDLRLDNAILTYSKDGAHCTDAKGEVTWNQTYGIQDVKVDICGDTVAIGDYNGRSIYVANSKELLGEITTTMPIRDLAVSETGNVTAVLADTDVTWVHTYNSDGELLYEGRAHMNNSGYPVDVSLSPSGELLCVSYVYVDAGVLKSNVAFYNLGAVGTSHSDHLVSAFPYTDILVPYVKFMNDNTVFAVGDSRLMIYSGSHQPVHQAEYLYDKEIKSVYYSEKYIGLVFMSDNNEDKYMLEVYDTSGERVGTFYFDMDYTDIFFGQDNFVIYNEAECQITTLDGFEKFNGSFSKTVRLVLPVGSAYKYVLITDSSIDTIQLK